MVEALIPFYKGELLSTIHKSQAGDDSARHDGKAASHSGKARSSRSRQGATIFSPHGKARSSLFNLQFEFQAHMADTTSSSASTPVPELSSQNRSVLKANSTDMGWEYAVKATNAQGWIVDGGDEDTLSDVTNEMVGNDLGVDSGLEPRRSFRIQEIRELEEDFDSDEEEEETMDFDFDSDTEEVLEGYGEEELEE